MKFIYFYVLDFNKLKLHRDMFIDLVKQTNIPINNTCDVGIQVLKKNPHIRTVYDVHYCLN